MGQLPFSSINYGLNISNEGRIINDAIIEGCIQGTGKNHKTAIFPCGIFQLKDGVNVKEGDPNYDLFQKACESTAKRIYPNYANCDWSVSKKWKEFDVNVKEKVLSELSQEELAKLKEALENNPELAEDYGIEIYED